MTDEQKRLVGHCIKELGYGWRNYLAGTMGAGNEAQHLEMMAAICRNALGHLANAAQAAKGV